MNKPQSGITNSRNRYGIIDMNQTNLLGNQSQSERSKFPSYWNVSQIQSGLAKGHVVISQVRINSKKYTDAYASHPKGDADIFIPGTRARNRCLNGDLAYIKIEPLSDWRVYDSFITEKVQEWASEHHKRGNLNSPYVTVGEFIQHDPEGFSKLFKDYSKMIKKNLDSFRDPSIPENFLKDLSWWQILQRVGKVVGIRKPLNCRIGMGYLRPHSATMFKSKENRQQSEELQTPDSEARPTITKWNNALFIPIDSRMPRVIIPKSKCPEEFVRQPETFKFVRFVAVITHWPDDSLFAKGHLIRKFDDESHSFIASETERILVNAGFAYGLEQCMRFPEFVEAHVTEKLIPSFSPEVLHKEISRRRDFRSECVFTIDPRTARDLDDALHIKLLSREETRREADLGFTDVIYEVGVHIADVSYYVRPEDPVDSEAANRATSIYLIQLCVPMLPRQLCEDLCSLHPGSDKLTFSVVFRLNSDGQVVSKWIGRTVINSRAKLSYEDAQAFIDEPERDWQASDLQDLKSGTDVNEVCRCVNMLNELAVKMRSRRFEGGALQLNQVKPTFTLSKETGEPIGLAPFIVRPANRLVEEWMLAANEAVALLLSKNLPQTAFLRRHPPPSRKQLREARIVLDFCDIDVNVSSAHSIQESLNKLAGSPKGIIWQHSDDLANLCASMMGCSVDPCLFPSKCATSSQKTELEQSRNLNKEAHLLATLNVLTRCMNLAEYFCLGQPNGSENADSGKSSSFQGHYALNMSHYTHFTSPIRRYADLIVHRQLAQILANKAAMLKLDEVASSYRATSKSDILDRPDKLATIADVCNARKLNSRKASEDSVELFFTVFVKECGPLVEACSVVNMLDRAFDVLILSTGLVRRVYLNRLDLVEWKFEKLAGSGEKGVTGIGNLYLQWKVHPLKSIEKGEEGESSFDVISTDPAVKGSVAAPPCNCFRQEIHLFDLVRCSVSVEGLNELEDGTAAVSVCKNDVDTLNSSKLDESLSILETSIAKPQQSGGEISDQTLNLRQVKSVNEESVDDKGSRRMQVGGIGHLRFFVFRQYILNTVNFKSTKVSSNVESFRNYDAYWPKTFITRMLNSDLLVEGRIRYTSPTSAFVINPSDGNKICIYSKALNRALPNDIVAVKLNNPAFWRVRAFLEAPDDPRSSCRLTNTSPIIPAEAEEEFIDESSEEMGSESLSILSSPSFQLNLERGGSNGNSLKTIPYPSVHEVLQTSPSLLPRLFPGMSSLDALEEQKPMTPLPSPHLLRTGRVVGVLGEDSASRRLVGRLVFESAMLMPSAFAEAESVDEFARPQQGVVEGSDGLPISVPAVNCFFVPEKLNFPRIKVLPSSVPKDLWENPHKAEGVRYICKIEDWPAVSPCPKGSLCGHIGNLHEIEPATQEILLSHGIHEDDFTEEMLKDLPASEEDFKIPSYEYLRRKDFRSYCVVSIDPSTAKDLDDALHVKMITKDIIEVGVHIADVSFFVRPFSALDREAANRTTSTYLVQRVIPMLPAILSEHLCSLNPGVDRLAFSVVFKVDRNANVLSVWFDRSVIRSCAKLSYEDALVLMGTSNSNLNNLQSRIRVSEPFTLANVKRSVTYLDMLAQKMRKRRMDNGALLLDKVELEFDLTSKVDESSSQSCDSNSTDSDSVSQSSKTGWPRGYKIKQRNRAHHLIEEWMLAANQAVARHLFHRVIRQKHREILRKAENSPATKATLTAAVGTSLAVFGRQMEMCKYRGNRPFSMGTVLRRHPAPQPFKMNELVKIAESAGIEMETSSAGAIRASLDAYIAQLRAKGTPESEVETLSTALSYLTYMRMQMALYFNVEDIVNRAIRRVRSDDPVTSASSDDLPTVSHESWESSLLRFSHHFGLNVPLYTHFTSPIRRYADLLVHRQLGDLLSCGHWSYRRPNHTSEVGLASEVHDKNSTLPPIRKPTIQASWCNRMRRETRRAQEESQQLFLTAWIKSVGSIQENAVVLSLSANKIQLLIPTCGLVINHNLGTFCREASGWQSESEKESKAPSLTVTWEDRKNLTEEGENREEKSKRADEKPAESITKLSILSVCPVKLTCSSRGFYAKAELLPPWGSTTNESTIKSLESDSLSEANSPCTDVSYSD